MIIPDVSIAVPQKGAQGVVKQDPLAPVTRGLEVAVDLDLKKRQRDSDAYEIKTNPDLYIGMRKAMEEARVEASTPEEMTDLFFKKSQDLYNPIFESAPNEIAKKNLEEKFSGLKASLGSQMIGLQAEEAQRTRILGTTLSNQQANNYILQTGDYEGGIKIIGDNLNKMDSFTSPSEKETMRQKAIEEANSAKLDNLFQQGKFDEVEAFLNNEGFGKYLSPDKQDAYRRAIVEQKQKLQKKAIEDPAGFTELMGAKTPEEKVAMQTAQGADPFKASVISNDQAKAEVIRWSKITDPTQLAAEVDRFNATYGKFTPNALNDLISNGLPAEYQHILALSGSDEDYNGKVVNAEQINLMYQLVGNRGKDGKGLVDLAKSQLSSDGNASKDFEERFNSEFYQEIGNILVEESKASGGSAEFVERIRKQSLDLAYAAYTQKRDIKAAQKFALDPLLNDHKRIINRNTINGTEVALRVPLKSDANAIEAGLDFAITLPVKMLDENLELAKFQGERTRDKAVWVQNDTGTGVILRTAKGEPVLGMDDKPVTYTFKDLEDLGKKLVEEKNLRLSDKQVVDILFNKGRKTKKLKEDIRVAKQKITRKKTAATAVTKKEIPNVREVIGVEPPIGGMPE